MKVQRKPNFLFLLFFLLLLSGDLTAQEHGSKGRADTEGRLKRLWPNCRGLILQGEYDEALKVLNRIVATDPRNDKAYLYRGLVRSHKSQYDRAIEDYSLALAVNPNSDQAYYLRGITYGRKGHYDREAEDYSKALGIELERQESNLFPQWARKGKSRDEEIEKSTRAISENPSEPWVYYHRGIVYRARGRFAEALSDLDKTLALAPRNVEAYYHRAACLRALGRTEAALKDWNEALSINPSLPWAYYQRGLLLRRKGLYGLAIENFSRALALDAGYAWAYFDRGVAYCLKGMGMRALRDFDLAMAVSPGYPPVDYNRGICFLQLGEEGKATSAMQSAARKGSEGAKKWLKERKKNW